MNKHKRVHSGNIAVRLHSNIAIFKNMKKTNKLNFDTIYSANSNSLLKSSTTLQFCGRKRVWKNLKEMSFEAA